MDLLDPVVEDMVACAKLASLSCLRMARRVLSVGVRLVFFGVLCGSRTVIGHL